MGGGILNGICIDCKNIGAIHEHHVVPRALGGTYTVPLCEYCHTKVHDKNMKISTLTKAALAKRKAEGKTLGRPKGSLSTSKLDGREVEILHMLDKGVSKASAAKMLDVSRGTLYNWLKSRHSTP